LLEKLPLFALAAASCVMTLWAQSEAIVSNESVPFSLRLGNAVISYVAYLGLLFYPMCLAVLYPHPESALPIWKIALSVLVLVMISVAAVLFRRRRPYLLVGWFWYLIMLLPVIGLVQVGLQSRADRYTYLPQIGLAMVIAWAAAEACRAWPFCRRMAWPAAALLLPTLMACSYHQVSFWENTETLWRRALECTSRNLVAQNNLGFILAGQGRFNEAMEYYRKALEIHPDYAEAHANLGEALIKLKRLDEAVEYLQGALKIVPDSPETRNNLGVALVEKGRLNEAAAQFRRALEIKPTYDEALTNLCNATGAQGVAQLQSGHPREAAELFKQVVALKPDSFKAHNNLGRALLEAGEPREAISHLETALRLRPDYTIAYYNLARAYALNRQPSEALAAAQKALNLARSQNQPSQVKEIEDWINSNLHSER
jgi:tetratricopeptide (TPR) repeat protein